VLAHDLREAAELLGREVAARDLDLDGDEASWRWGRRWRAEALELARWSPLGLP
jgi:hypothetical protein